jgi:hypothetical protein
MTEDQLDALVGRQVEYDGRRLRIVEWLPEGPSLVLADTGDTPRIQDDQFGEARRRAPETWTIPVYEHASNTYHPLLRELGLI